MELKQVANYQVGRYLTYNKKSDKKELLTGKIFGSFSVDYLGTYKKEIVYYDTKDFFFADRGINIYTASDNYSRELIIRYDNEQVKRIEFLKNTPNFFKVAIDKKDTFNSFTTQINDAICQVYPEGLHVNIEETLRSAGTRIRIIKKSEQYRVVNNKGLKTTIAFEDCNYFDCSSRAKFSQSSLEVIGEKSDNKDDFNDFLRQLVIECPKLIKIESNELTVARNGL